MYTAVECIRTQIPCRASSILCSVDMDIHEPNEMKIKSKVSLFAKIDSVRMVLLFLCCHCCGGCCGGCCSLNCSCLVFCSLFDHNQKNYYDPKIKWRSNLRKKIDAYVSYMRLLKRDREKEKKKTSPYEGSSKKQNANKYDIWIAL